MTRNSEFTAALHAAFPHTVPILAGFWFIGIAYGVYAHAAGFPWWYPPLLAATIYAGSMEFVTISLLMQPFNPLQAFLLTLVVNARHLFYGLSMMERFRGMGWLKPYLIFGMSDETFSINYTADIPAGINRRYFYFWVTLLDCCYWLSGVLMGSLFGNLITFKTDGIDFVMTAMFIVIFLEQWFKDPQHVSGALGLALSAACLSLFGETGFIIPSMILMLLTLLAMRGRLEPIVLPPSAVNKINGGNHD